MIGQCRWKISSASVATLQGDPRNRFFVLSVKGTVQLSCEGTFRFAGLQGDVIYLARSDVLHLSDVSHPITSPFSPLVEQRSELNRFPLYSRDNTVRVP